MEKRISVVLPTYNGEKVIKKSIESVLSQTYSNWELIIINDGSTDNTLKVIESYEQSDPRIQVINNSTNQKLPRSLNIGFSHATGELLTWTSDDNSYHPDAFEILVNALNDNPDVDFVYSDFNVVDLDGNFLWSEEKRESDKLRFYNTVGACFLYKKSLANVIGEYDSNMFLAEDYEYWIRAYLNGKLLHIPYKLYDYGWHDKSLTSTRKAEISKATFLAKEKHFDELLARCINQDERNTFFWEMLAFLTDPNEYNIFRKKYYRLDTSFAKANLRKMLQNKITAYRSMIAGLLSKLQN